MFIVLLLNGLYVHAPKVSARDIKSTVKYVIRYAGRPSMAQSRIIDYDGDFVTFWYDRHEDNMHVVEKIHVYEFIKRLIIHIPDEYFNLVRYYGLYAKDYKHSHKLFKMRSDISNKAHKMLNKWQYRIELYFNRNPLICSCCASKLHFDYLVLKAYNTS